MTQYPQNNLRYERKYSFDLIDSDELLPAIEFQGFVTTYPDRQVNSLYFDTPQYDFYHQSMNGTFDRKKIRIRWYGELVNTEKDFNSQLEIKYKYGELGGKEIIPLNDFTFSSIIEDNHYHRLEEYMPTVLTTYQRQYFEHQTYPVRLTIDTNLRSNYSPNHFKVLEIKYPQSFTDTKFISNVINSLPLQLSQFSKYVMGVGEFGG